MTNKTVTYVAQLQREDDGGYVIIFPDLDGCVTEGETRQEALDNAHTALRVYAEAHLDTGKYTGQQLPEPKFGSKEDLSNTQARITVELSDLV